MEDYGNIKDATTQEEILSIIMCLKVAEQKAIELVEINKIKALQKGIQLLAVNDEFVVEDNVVYFKGISRSLPQILVEELIVVVSNNSGNLSDNEEFQSLKRFFMWCCLNPRVEVANELYRFLKENSFRITKQGFFVALRNVVTLHGSPEFVHFISNAYNKVKAVWKKNPNDYLVFLQNEEYKLIHKENTTKITTSKDTTCPDCGGEGGWWESSEFMHVDDEWIDCDTCHGTGEVEEYLYEIIEDIDHGQLLGTLTELYLDLPNRAENRFTDDWTKTFDIRIGQVTSMPQEDCNWSTQDCAAEGLK